MPEKIWEDLHNFLEKIQKPNKQKPRKDKLWLGILFYQDIINKFDKD